MSSDSRNTKRKRRLRRNISLLSRQNRALQNELMKTRANLVLMLAQIGGSLLISKGVLETTVKNFQRLGYETKPVAAEQSDVSAFSFHLVETPEAPSADTADTANTAVVRGVESVEPCSDEDWERQKAAELGTQAQYLGDEVV